MNLITIKKYFTEGTHMDIWMKIKKENVEKTVIPIVQNENERWSRMRRTLNTFILTLTLCSSSGTSIMVKGYKGPFSYWTAGKDQIALKYLIYIWWLL